MVPGTSSDLARNARRTTALVPGEAIVDSGVSLLGTRSSALIVAGGVAINLTVYFLAVSQAVFGNLVEASLLTLLGGLIARPFWKRWRSKRRLDSARPLRIVTEASGQQVRLAGVVHSEGPVLKTPKGHPAVLVRYQGCRGSEHGARWSSLWRWETHAVDFWVRADDGRELRVDTRSIVLLPHPPIPEQSGHQRRPLYLHATGEQPGPLSWIFEEETIAPGDRIEVGGTLDLVHHPSVPAGSDRQARLLPILRGTAEQPVQIRRHYASTLALP